MGIINSWFDSPIPVRRLERSNREYCALGYHADDGILVNFWYRLIDHRGRTALLPELQKDCVFNSTANDLICYGKKPRHSQLELTRETSTSSDGSNCDITVEEVEVNAPKALPTRPVTLEIQEEKCG